MGNGERIGLMEKLAVEEGGLVRLDGEGDTAGQQRRRRRHTSSL